MAALITFRRTNLVGQEPWKLLIPLGDCPCQRAAVLSSTGNTVIASLEISLLNHLGTDGFTLKLNTFGKFYVRHKPGIRRKIGFTGETIQTKALRKVKFVSLGMLRQLARVDY